MSSTAPKPLVDCGRGPGGMDEVEWQLRVQTAAAYRLIQRNGWNELIWGHTTTRLPGAEHQFLINPYGLRYDEVTASSLVVIDLDGNIVEPGAHAVNPAGFVIHSAIHEHRDDAYARRRNKTLPALLHHRGRHVTSCSPLTVQVR